MANMNKLRGKIIENGFSVELLAERIGIDRSTFYRRIADNGDSFTIREVQRIINELSLTMDDTASIFFTFNVA